MRGERTVGVVIAETTEAIWSCLQPEYLPVPTIDMWKNLASRYEQLWSLPHCVGSIDGKHVRIKKFKKSGSRNFNYKGYFSVQLMACSDADGCFITVDVGDLGRNSDGGVFRSSRLGRWLQSGGLNLPQPSPLPRDENAQNFPYFFCGDEAFPLTTYILRPYPQRTLTDRRRIFNYRISLARKSVECAFGMLTSKFRVFETSIACSEATVISIIKCACVLHNYIRKTEGKMYKPRNAADEVQNIPNQPLHPLNRHINLTTAASFREYLCEYFLKPGVAIPSQWINNIAGRGDE